MSNSAARFSFLTLVALILSPGAVSQTVVKPMNANEVVALEAGGALPENIIHEMGARGLSFHPDEDCIAKLKKAGADTAVLSALLNAKVAVVSDNGKPESLLHISNAAVLIKDARYDEAGAELNAALKISFAGAETGFVMGELLRRKEEWQQAATVYAEVLRQRPDFPEAHTKLSYLLYRLGDSEGALQEAKAALAQNPEDAEAHKNAGLALSSAQKFDAAMSEYKKALSIKPDYAVVHYDLGLLFYNQADYDNSIGEYTKAIVLDADNPDIHTNLGNAYRSKGDIASAIREHREAKRLDPNDPMVRQNLASALMSSNPREAIAELLELEKKFPDFEICHVCLGRGLAWAGDTKGAEAEFSKAAELDPSDPEPHSGLGTIQEGQKNYAAALEEFRLAEKLGEDVAHTHQDVGRVLLAQKDYAGAVAELKQAEGLSPSDWRIHDLYAQALDASGQNDLAISEFKEAASIDPKQSQVIFALGSALEKKGDWVGALELYRKAALTEASASANGKHQMGESFAFSTEAQKGYKAAQLRFAKHLAALRASGKSAEAAALEDRVRAMDNAPGILEKVQVLMQSAQQALQERRFSDAENGYQQAVGLAEHLPPGDENLIVALGQLGNAYSFRQDYTDAEAAFHRQMTIIEKTFGPGSPRMTTPLVSLGSLAAGLRNYAAAESYFSRALEINEKVTGEKSSVTAESLRMMAGLYEVQGQYEKAEPYLVRAVQADDANGDDALTLVPLWGLCGLYDHLGKTDKSQRCWHRATALMEKQVGEDSPDLLVSITNEAKALRQLGRKGEADQLEQRSAKIRRTAAPAN